MPLDAVEGPAEVTEAPAESSEAEARREAERRDASRAAVTLRVEYKRLNAFFADYTNNISKGGSFIRTTKPLAVGTEFVFELAIASTADKVALRGEVMWITTEAEADPEADKPAGMGIRFVFDHDSERHALQELVERLMAESLGAAISTRLLAARPALG